MATRRRGYRTLMQRHHRTGVLICSVLGLVGLSACGDDTDVDGAIDSVVDGSIAMSTDPDVITSDSLSERLDRIEQALSDGNFTTVLQLLELSGLADELEGRQVTILAPTDEAFAALDAGDVQDLLSDPARVDDVLSRHVVDGLVPYDELSSTSSLRTIGDDTLVVTTAGDRVMVEGALVSPPTNSAVDGNAGGDVIVLGIDRVLLDES
jgi:uncharacterized surface protein with fasciclin (FAS1) repeats